MTEEIPKLMLLPDDDAENSDGLGKRMRRDTAMEVLPAAAVERKLAALEEAIARMRRAAKYGAMALGVLLVAIVALSMTLSRDRITLREVTTRFEDHNRLPHAQAAAGLERLEVLIERLEAEVQE